MEAIGFDPRNTAKFGGGAVMKECDLTQTADQYKQPHCVAIVAPDFLSTADSDSRRSTSVANVSCAERQADTTARS